MCTYIICTYIYICMYVMELDQVRDGVGNCRLLHTTHWFGYIYSFYSSRNGITTTTTNVVDQDYQCVQSIASWLGKYVIKLWQCCRLIKSRQPRHGAGLSVCLPVLWKSLLFSVSHVTLYLHTYLRWLTDFFLNSGVHSRRLPCQPESALYTTRYRGV